jgi:hypothetical protein
MRVMTDTDTFAKTQSIFQLNAVSVLIASSPKIAQIT